MPDLGEMKIQIAQIPCTDDMSGKENKYQVTVELKRGIDQDFKIFKGCGNYVTDYRLHDIWMLEEINGQSINVTQYDKERPRIEINAEQNTFLGSTGSHDINGKIFFERGLLRFIDIAVPQNLNAAEKDFIKNIQSATNYKLEDYRMVLFNPSGELLKFRKTD
jgi:heat shock protein HslJ